MKYVFKLEELDCAHCAAKMEKAIAKIDGVESATISFLAQKLTIECSEEIIAEVIKKAKAEIKKVEPDCVLIEK